MDIDCLIERWCRADDIDYELKNSTNGKKGANDFYNPGKDLEVD
jgi:hypothetical protein